MTTAYNYRLRQPYSPTDRIAIIKQLRSMFSIDMKTTSEFLDLLIKDEQFVLQDATKLRYSGYVNDASAPIQESIKHSSIDDELDEYYQNVVKLLDTRKSLFAAGCAGDAEAALKFCQHVKHHGWGQAFG